MRENIWGGEYIEKRVEILRYTPVPLTHGPTSDFVLYSF